MIRINLLPSDERSSKRRISLPTISGGAVLWVTLGIVLYGGAVAGIWTLQARKINEYNVKIEALKEESARLAPQLAKIRKLQKEREEVNRRLSVIAALDKDRYLRVRVMNDLCANVPDNCWLTSLNESGGTKVSIEGVTFSNFIIADFMSDLEKSGRFGQVSLVKAEEGDIDDVRVVKFSLNASLLD